MASKSKSRRRVFRASCILAALIIAGSSFAWFSSKDEVTNRLSASANYGVSIVEDFQPPKNFLPGQKVNKDVAVVNTGNVDAFVRTWIDGEMSLVAKTDYQDAAAVDVPNSVPTLVKTADDQTKLTGVNLNWYDNNGTYYKELSQIKSENPENATTSDDPAVETTIPQSGENTPARFSEVQSVQAGGVLVYHDYTAAVADNPDTADEDESADASGAEYYYVLEQATTITNSEGATAMYPAGTYVHTPGSCVKANTDIDEDSKVEIPYDYYGEIDTSQFYPESSGLYLFRRNVDINSTKNTADDYEYTGYYFIASDADKTTTASAKGDDVDTFDVRNREEYNPVYLALCYDTSHDQRSDYVLPDGAVTPDVTSEPTKDEVLPVTLVDVEFYTAQEKVLNSYGENGFVWSYTPYGAAAEATYTLTNADDGDDTKTLTAAPVLSGETLGAYSWTVSDGTDTYWATTQAGPYYKSSSFTGTLLNEGATAYNYTSTEASDATGGVLTATYGDDDKEIKINVKLANLDNNPTASTAETWSVIKNENGDDKKWTFYYNNDVEEGASTTKLIDYVELDKTVKDEAFLAFDFDLNVFMESVQVVLDDTGNETCNPVVTPWANQSLTENNANTNYNAATGAEHNDGAEIDYITWTAT